MVISVRYCAALICLFVASAASSQQSPSPLSSSDTAWWNDYLKKIGGLAPNPSYKGQALVQKIIGKPGYYVDGYMTPSGGGAIISVDEEDAIPRFTEILKKSPSIAGRWTLDVTQPTPKLAGDGDIDTNLYQRLQAAKDLCVPTNESMVSSTAKFFDALSIVCSTRGCNCGFNSQEKKPLIIMQDDMMRSGPGQLGDLKFAAKTIPSDPSLSKSCPIQFYRKAYGTEGKYNSVLRKDERGSHYEMTTGGYGSFVMPNGKRGMWAAPGTNSNQPAPTTIGWIDQIKKQFCEIKAEKFSAEEGNSNSNH